MGLVERFLGLVERFLGLVERFLGFAERFLGFTERFLGFTERFLGLIIFFPKVNLRSNKLFPCERNEFIPLIKYHIFLLFRYNNSNDKMSRISVISKVGNLEIIKCIINDQSKQEPFSSTQTPF